MKPLHPSLTSVPVREERLPLHIERVTDVRVLRDVVRVRSEAYGRKVAALGAQLREVEIEDLVDLVVAVRREDTGAVLASMRFHCSDRGGLSLQKDCTLPRSFAGKRLAEAVRLSSVLPSAYSDLGLQKRIPVHLLFKAFYFYCLAREVDHMVIGARDRAIARMYRDLGFAAVFEKPVPLASTGGIEHEILSHPVSAFEAKWFAQNHPLKSFVFETHHPQLDWLLEVQGEVEEVA